jgi:hypothetical protein
MARLKTVMYAKTWCGALWNQRAGNIERFYRFARGRSQSLTGMRNLMMCAL